MLRRLKAAMRILRYCTTGLTRSVPGLRKAFTDGHFYSPIVDTRETQGDATRIWPDKATAIGIDFNEAEHRHWLTEILPRHLPHYDYPDALPPDANDSQFYTRNSQFSWLDARSLFTFLREFRPQRMIEIGSGFSSLLAADVNRRFLGNGMDLTCIEPYPRSFLRKGVPGITRLVESRVQHVPMDLFTSLEAGDILFIDSSHVSKTGSDVNHIYLEILPRLRPGVVIHIHDIFLPNDYPKAWVLDMGINWNEQYLVQAMLIHSRGFQVIFGCAYALEHFPDLLEKALGGNPYGGGSLWLRKLPS